VRNSIGYPLAGSYHQLRLLGHLCALPLSISMTGTLAFYGHDLYLRWHVTDILPIGYRESVGRMSAERRDCEISFAAL
jgi:hypothetical protein